ncbi:MAG: SHOCT domain-containing protein [Pseudanabaenaceae cyanobacterium]
MEPDRTDHQPYPCPLTGFRRFGWLAILHNAQENTMRKEADTVIRRYRSTGFASSAPSTAYAKSKAVAKEAAVFPKLEKLAKRRDAGVITLSEFEAKKAELLQDI